jgi:hypothetical protein
VFENFLLTIDLLMALLAAIGLVLSLALLIASRRALPGCGPRSSCQLS